MAYQPFYSVPCAATQDLLVGEVIALDDNHLLLKELSPYTAYQWRIEAVNSVGESDSQRWSVTSNTNPSGTSSYLNDNGLLYVEVQ